MPNLTLEKRLVKPALDANPVPDHDVVVFLKVGGGGLRFHSRLGPGDKLSLTDKLFLGSRITAYAVTRDQNLRHKVAVPGLKSADHVGPFTLDLTLALRINDPQILVEKLESDPLGRLEKEVKEVFGRVASRMEWSGIQAPACDFEDQLLSSTVMDETGRRVASLAFLQGFAMELGLEVKGVQASRQLTAEVGEAARVLMREREQRIIDEELQKSALKSEHLQAQREEFQAWKTNALSNIQRLGEISASATKNLTKVLEQIADKVDSAPALRTVMNELIAMRDEIAMISSVGGSSPGNGGSREMKTLGTSGPALLGAVPAAGISGLLAQLAALPLEPADRNRLNSCLLRLAGEITLHGDADPTVIDECFHSLADQMPHLVQAVQSAEQRDLLIHLQDKDWLQAELARR
jgi:hypothetical protein